MKSRRLQKRYVFITIAAVVILAAALLFIGSVRGNAVKNPGEVYIPTGSDLRSLTDSLEAGDRIENMNRFMQVAKVLDLDKGIRPGHYVLKKGMSYPAVVRMFSRGLQTPVKVTFNNVRTLPQLAGRVSRQIEPDSLTLTRFLVDDTTARHYGFTPETFIAMFVPDTYEAYWNSSPAAFADRMKRNYDSFWNETRRSKAEAIGLSPEQVVTLASIVYEETKMSDEMPTVAGVYINRLRIGMPLQADPTLKFAVGDFAIRRVLDRHKEVVSPYNTYMYKGLPPGPIAMPSTRAIDAVLDYQHHKYLYFCARPDFSGYHNFAVTLAQHNQNRQAWIAALNARGIR